MPRGGAFLRPSEKSSADEEPRKGGKGKPPRPGKGGGPDQKKEAAALEDRAISLPSRARQGKGQQNVLAGEPDRGFGGVLSTRGASVRASTLMGEGVSAEKGEKVNITKLKPCLPLKGKRGRKGRTVVSIPRKLTPGRRILYL